jgi:hypothetical protein
MSSDHITPEDDDLDFARRARRDVEAALRSTKGEIPEDPRMLQLYLSNLDGIERSALGKKRLQTDEKLGNVQTQAASLLAEMFRNPRVSQLGKGSREDIPVLDHDIAPTRVLEGELGNSNSGDSYEAFVNRTQPADAGASA